MLEKLSLEEFLLKTASNEPVPGGGSVAAMASATAAALTEMVAQLTIGRKKYEAVEGEMMKIQRAAQELRKELIAEINRDVMEAMKLPKETEGEKQARGQAIQKATIHAAQVPLGVAEKTLSMMPIIEQVVEKGNQNAVTDGAVAAMMARTAVLSALYNVKINLASIKDEALAVEMNRQVEEMEQGALDWEKKILSKVKL